MKLPGAPNLPPVVPWALGFAGVGLIWAAMKGESPIGALRAVITGSPLPGGSDGDAGGATTPGVADQPGSLITVNNPPGYQPATFKLTAPAAAAFRAWGLSFGAAIPVTGGWRSSEEQAAGHARDPGKFAEPGTSQHEKGRAVDVDMNWINRLNADQQARFRKAAKATGWGQARYKRGEAGCGSAKGKESDNDEPWHFSWGVCG